MEAPGKGEVSLLLVLLLLIYLPSPSFSLVASISSVNGKEHRNGLEEHEYHQEHDRDRGVFNLSDRQEIQLKRLENLIENLSEVVSRLESSLYGIGSLASLEKEQLLEAEKPLPLECTDTGKYSPISSDTKTRSKPVEIGRGGITVTKYKPSWSERFQFLSAVRMESEATCVNILPYEDYEGFSKYVAVGDGRGWVYIFTSGGDVLVEFKTDSDSPVTSMLSYMSVWKNESFLVTGHRDGAILVHRVWEAPNEEWNFLSMGKFRELVPPGMSVEDLSVLLLEMHNVGRMRYFLCSDAGGRIKVFYENGTLYGTASLLSRPLVFLKQRLLFLTENGVGSLDLRRMTVRESECEGLNGSLVKRYVFDASERSKAYGFTSEGDLIHVVVLGDMMNFKCMVRAKRKSEMEDPLAVQTLKGYLLVINREKVFVYNISSQSYTIRHGGPRPLFYATLDEIRASFLNPLPSMSESSVSRNPLLSTDREKLVVLGLGIGYIGIYRSNLPVSKAEFSTVLWGSPVVVCFLFLIGAWQFLGRKRETFDWNPDDPLAGNSVGSGSGDRSFVDLREVRGGALIGPPRRYASPTRYPPGTNTSFRPTSNDPSFRAPTDLKYRGQNLDVSFPKRRDPLFSNNQVVEDHVD